MGEGVGEEMEVSVRALRVVGAGADISKFGSWSVVESGASTDTRFGTFPLSFDVGARMYCSNSFLTSAAVKSVPSPYLMPAGNVTVHFVKSALGSIDFASDRS